MDMGLKGVLKWKNTGLDRNSTDRQKGQRPLTELLTELGQGEVGSKRLKATGWR